MNQDSPVLLETTGRSTQAAAKGIHDGVAMVTGSTVRVGLQVALALARSGRDVFLHARHPGPVADDALRQVRATGRSAWLLIGDLDDAARIRSMFESISTATGRLDILVNSAAIFGVTPPDRLTADDFDRFIGTNLRAPYLCSIHARELMKPGSSIINISDVAASRPFRNHVPYCVSKAGLEMMTKALAKAWAPDIRVNAIAPGTVLFRDDEDEDIRKVVTSRIPMGRIGTPSDIVDAVLYLTDHARHTTGAVLPVDGGRVLD